MRDMLVFKNFSVNWQCCSTQHLYFSVFLAAVMAAACLSPAQAQINAEQNASRQTNILLEPRSKEDEQAASGMPELRPTPADIKQSAVTGIPVPPQITLPDPVQPVIAKEPLAWRAKALAMSVEYPFNEKNGAVWVLPIAYDKGQALFKQALNQADLELVAEYPDAGQYLIHIPDIEMKSTKKDVCRGEIYPPIRSGGLPGTVGARLAAEVIIVSQPVGDSKTLFKLRICSGAKTAQTKKIYALPPLMKELFEHHGLWQ